MSASMVAKRSVGWLIARHFSRLDAAFIAVVVLLLASHRLIGNVFVLAVAMCGADFLSVVIRIALRRLGYEAAPLHAGDYEKP